MKPILTEAGENTVRPGLNARPELWREKTRDVINMRIQFPSATNAEIAKRLSVSRQWVWHVLNRANLRIPRPQTEYCELVCAGCGLIFRRKVAEVERHRKQGQTKFYHDGKCSLLYLNRHGINRHKSSKRKWDYEAVYKLRREKNWGSVRISRELGIPTPTVLRILRNGNLAHRHQRADYEAIWKLRREKKWGSVKIGRELGIPRSTVTQVLRRDNRFQ